MSNYLSRVRQKLKRKPVTLIVGIICADGIVVASDSQTTWGSGKSWDAKKMNEVSYPHGRALIAESGAVITSAESVRAFSELAQTKIDVQDASLGSLSEAAVRQVREKLRTQHFGCSSEELKRIIDNEGLECELMIAYHDKDRNPMVDTISLSIGIANRCKGFYEAVGSGADLAQYLLSELCVPKMNVKTGSIVAVHIVEIVKRHDPWCGGPTKLGIILAPTPLPRPMISPPGMENALFNPLGIYYQPPILVAQSEVSEIVGMALEVEDSTRKTRGELIRAALEKRANRRIKEILEIEDDLDSAHMLDDP